MSFLALLACIILFPFAVLIGGGALFMVMTMVWDLMGIVHGLFGGGSPRRYGR